MRLVKLQHSSLVVLAAAFACTSLAQDKPVKFAGELKAGQSLRKPIGRGLAFALKGDDDGWTIEVQPETPHGESCRNYSTVIAIPLRGYTGNDLNVSYGLSAADALQRRTREVHFVLDEAACKREHEWANRLMWSYSYSKEQVAEAEQKFGSSAGGRALVRILDFKTSPSGDLTKDGKDLGKIDWIKFEVEIVFTTAH
jgi:hypothetical protein